MDQSTLAGTNEILRKRSLTDEVYLFLYDKIIAGKYSAGDWLRQDDISTVLGVSQTPVREAFDRLVAAGLAERVPYRGVRVPKLDQKEIVDAFILRLVLESAAARLAAGLIQDEEVKALNEIIDKTMNLISLADMSTLRQLNKEFHTRLVDTANSPLLSKLYEMAINSFPDWMLYEYMFRHPELLESSIRREYQEHKAIISALASKDPEIVAFQVANHIKNQGKDLESVMDIPHDILFSNQKQIDPMLITQYPSKTE